MALSMKISTILVSVFLLGCDSETKWESGKYQVYWIDISSDLKLGYDVDGGIIQRVGPQVTAIGENERWIVAARHPDGDRSRTEYFYIPKAEDGPFKDMKEIVKGPFTGEEFNKEKVRLKLPAFSERF